MSSVSEARLVVATMACLACTAGHAAEEADTEERSETQPSATASRVVLEAAGRLGESMSATDGAQLVDGMDVPTVELPEGKRGRFVVVPIPFRNALLGAGLTLGAGYLYQPKDAVTRGRHSVAGVGGMYTEGDSWALAGGHRA